MSLSSVPWGEVLILTALLATALHILLERHRQR